MLFSLPINSSLISYAIDFEYCKICFYPTDEKRFNCLKICELNHIEFTSKQLLSKPARKVKVFLVVGHILDISVISKHLFF